MEELLPSQSLPVVKMIALDCFDVGYHPDYVNIESIKDLQNSTSISRKLTVSNPGPDSLTEINEIIKEGIEQRTGKQMTRNER
ncbi:MAG: hypothetical protein H6765_00015 [Candidatus Peribacteria bacterium]|nr:MAG: hypothetical protein H6765_00015 [Candidatus Peribacteria bacterium]